MSWLTVQATFDDLVFTFDDLVMTFDGWITMPVSIIYLEGEYNPAIELTGSP